MSVILPRVSPPYTPTGQTRERVYTYVRARLEAGQPPTVREVQEEFGFRAVETARRHLEQLVAEERLAKRPGVARGYCLPAGTGGSTDGGGAAVAVPLIGRVAAGGLTEAIEHREGIVMVEGTGGDGVFALRVEGESMVGVGILPGDVVIVRAQSTARSGQIVVALVDDEATVKTLRRTGRRVELWPENPDFEPIVPPVDRLTILGRVTEVRRYLS